MLLCFIYKTSRKQSVLFNTSSDLKHLQLSAFSKVFLRKEILEKYIV